MYSGLTQTQIDLLKESYLEAVRLGATDTVHAVACAAHDVLVPEAAEWCGSKGQDAFAAALASLVMDRVIKLKGPAKRTGTKKIVEQIGAYYDYPNQGWWNTKQARAKHMTLVGLVWSRRDCNDTAKNGMPENHGKYTDEATIYAAEIKKRTGTTDVEEVH